MPEEATKTEEELEQEKQELEQEKQDDKDGFIPLPEIPEEKKEVGEGELEEVPDKKPDEKKEEISDFKPTPIEKVGDELFEEIVHGGQVHRITKDKYKELAQKGFDYDNKVGPHGKIARMIEADPAIAQMVEDAWAGKFKPKAEEVKLKPLTDYEDEDTWLKDNLQSAVAAAVTNKQPPPPSPVTQTVGPSVAQTLMMRDPQHFQLVMNKMPQYLNQLSVENYKRVDTDLSVLCEFYDYVKDQEISKAKIPSSQTIQKPSFKVRSGGVDLKRGDTEDFAWKLSNDDFEKQLARIKGYG